MRLSKIREGSSNLAFGSSTLLAAPGERPGEVWVHHLPKDRDERPRRPHRIAVDADLSLRGWADERRLLFLRPATADAPAALIAQGLAERTPAVVADLTPLGDDPEVVTDDSLRLAAPRSATQRLPILDLRARRVAIYLASSRRTQVQVQRFALDRLVVAERSSGPGGASEAVYLVDPLRPVRQARFDGALTVLPSPQGKLALLLLWAEGRLEARLTRLSPLGTTGEPIALRSYPRESPEARWLAEVATRPTFRPFRPDGGELVLPQGEGSVRITTSRTRDQTPVPLVRAVGYSPDGRWLAGTATGIAQKGTWLCVERL